MLCSLCSKFGQLEPTYIDDMLDVSVSLLILLYLLIFNKDNLIFENL